MRLALSILLAAGALALPTGAYGAIDFAPCPGEAGVECGTLTVPVARSGATGGTIDLHVERVRHGTPSGPPVFALAGGPGEAATDFTHAFTEELGPVLAKRDLIVFDQRGTGESGALHCAGIEAGEDASKAMP